MLHFALGFHPCAEVAVGQTLTEEPAASAQLLHAFVQCLPQVVPHAWVVERWGNSLVQDRLVEGGPSVEIGSEDVVFHGVEIWDEGRETRDKR